jgi:outer membrane lipoprotein-sorting protein
MKRILLLLAVYNFLNSSGQDDMNVIIQDVAAEPYLEQISKLFNPDRAFQLEFKYDIETPEPPSIVSDYGSIIIKGDKYKLKTEDAEIYFNGKTLWVYNINSAEVYRSIPSGVNMDEMLLSPFSLIKEYKKYYKYSLKEEVILSGTAFVNIELYPKDLNSSCSIFKVVVNKKNGTLYSSSLHKKDGIIYTVYFREFIKDIKISESTFSWNPELYPGVLEIEM